MNRTFWKNFNLGIELDIAGNFIYNGLKYFDEMESLYYDDDIFTFLYQIAVGIERLEKISLILIENKEDIENEKQLKFEESLKSHNHIELLRRIKKYHKLTFNKEHNKFIQILTNFYKDSRYGRYSLANLNNYDEEKNILVTFINKYSTENIDNTFGTPVRQNNTSIKNFIGEVVQKIVLSLYQVIETESKNQNILTHEIRFDSKASKIFLQKKFDFNNEKILIKELMIFMLKNNSGFIKYLKSIEALDFDETMLPYYFKCFNNDVVKLKYIDELNSQYESVKNAKERFQYLDILDFENIDFDDIDKD